MKKNIGRALLIVFWMVSGYVGLLAGGIIKNEQTETSKQQIESGLVVAPYLTPTAYPHTPRPIGPAQDERVRKIRAFFERTNEDMVGYSGNFVISADRYGVDPFLLVAVGALESGHYRYCVDGNCFGHACSVRNCGYTNIKEGIEGGARLFAHERYAGKSIENIGIIYAADQMWSSKVRAIYAELVGK